MDLFNILKKFLDKNLDKKKPILLGFSGGVDSSALLDLLLKYKNSYPLDLHVATIDHGWRSQSKFECELIKKKMKKLKVPFHFKKLNLKQEKNLENLSREERLLFFKKLYKKYNFQALLLAHQKDDLAETVLKRVLEGANLFSFTAMKKISTFDDMIIWRPILEVSRKELIEYLNENNISYFHDKTNDNTKFLRAKMRKDIFPYLQKNFNKQILENFKILSKRSSELDSYLTSKLEPVFKKLKKNSLGICLDLNDVKHSLELKFIIKKIAFNQKVDLSRDVIDQLSFWLLKKKANLRLKLRNANVFADRGYFFIFKKDFQIFEEKIYLKEGILDLKDWQVAIKKVKKIKKNSSWQDFFRDGLKIYVPKDEYHIALVSRNKKFKKLWENAKVPAFLRLAIPALYHKNKVIYDFLSNRTIKLNNNEIWQILLKLK